MGDHRYKRRVSPRLAERCRLNDEQLRGRGHWALDVTEFRMLWAMDRELYDCSEEDEREDRATLEVLKLFPEGSHEEVERRRLIDQELSRRGLMPIYHAAGQPWEVD